MHGQLRPDLEAVDVLVPAANKHAPYPGRCWANCLQGGLALGQMSVMAVSCGTTSRKAEGPGALVCSSAAGSGAELIGHKHRCREALPRQLDGEHRITILER